MGRPQSAFVSLLLVVACSSEPLPQPLGSGGIAAHCYTAGGYGCHCFNSDQPPDSGLRYDTVERCDNTTLPAPGTCCAKLDLAGFADACDCLPFYCSQIPAYFGCICGAVDQTYNSVIVPTCGVAGPPSAGIRCCMANDRSWCECAEGFALPSCRSMADEVASCEITALSKCGAGLTAVNSCSKLKYRAPK